MSTVHARVVCEALETRRHLHGDDDGPAADNFGINAGGAAYTDTSGLTWQADRGFNASTSARLVTSNNAIAGTDLDALFHTARQDYNMKFASALPDGAYTVKLYFAEQRLLGVGQRVFSVNIENTRVLTDLDIYKTAGANTAVIKTFTTTVKDGTLNVDFLTGKSTALIDAIRVQPAEVPADATFRPGAIAWSTRQSDPVRREEAVSFTSGGRLYVVGGYVNAQFQATTRVDVYDPATNTWSRRKDAPTKITHTGLAIDPATGNVWMCGGLIGDFDLPKDLAPGGTDVVWKYNPAADTWTRGPDLPVARGGGGAAIVNNKLYYFSGVTADRKSSSGQSYVLDLSDQAAGWKAIASVPTPRNHFGTATVGGKIYVIGGQTGIDKTAFSLSSVYVYDPSTNQWAATTPLPMPYSHFTSTLSVYKGRYVLIAGGENPHNTAKSDVRIFDTVTRRWATLTHLPDIRRAAAGGIIGSTYVVTGGYKYTLDQLSETWTADLTRLGL